MSNLEIPERDKKRIGQLIRFYRGFTHRTQKDLIINVYGIKICSRKTLVSIESGRVIQLDKIYEELLLNLGLRYSFDHHIEEYEQAFQQLLRHCEYYDVKNIIKTACRIKADLKPYKDYIFFHECYSYLQIILQYYEKHRIPDKGTVEYIAGIIRILHTPLDDIVIDLLFKGCVRYELDYTAYYDYSHASNIINRMNHLLTLVYGNKLQSAFVYILTLEQELTATKNTLRLLDLYNIKMTFYKKAEEQDFLAMSERLIAMMHDTSLNIPDIKKAQTYKNLSICAYKLDILTIAESGIKKFLEYDDREQIPYIVILIDIYQKTGDYIAINDITIYQKVRFYRSRYDVYYNYFLFKYKYAYSPANLNTYIMKDILEALDPTDSIFARIFYRELSDLVKVTKHYKDTTLFMDKLCQLFKVQSLD